MTTKHASPERDDIVKIVSARKRIMDTEFIRELINSLPYIAAILNSKRQIVFSNQKLLNSLNLDSVESILGVRIGEAINCIHYKEETGGCGTSESCQYCGAVNAVLQSHAVKTTVSNEYRITSQLNNRKVHYDYRITAIPFALGDEQFTIISLSDISNEKRRNALERIFFHDILNTAGSLNGILEIIEGISDIKKVHEFVSLAKDTSRYLIDEILDQRELLAAEQNELKVRHNIVFSVDLLKEIIKRAMYYSVARNKIIAIDKNVSTVSFTTDDMLLKRVLINMLKNALEATTDKGKVVIGCDDDEGYITFWVNNKGMIPRDIQLQIFQRSFSTKGPNRGLGTYCMKLLGEQYLRGKVYFVTDQHEGTTFYIKLRV